MFTIGDLRDMFSGHAHLEHLDNDRYDEVHWTRVQDQLGANSG